MVTKRNALLIFYMLICISGICQDRNYPDKSLKINFQRVIFEAGDSACQFTFYKEPNGQFYFTEGFDKKENEKIYRIDKKQVIENDLEYNYELDSIFYIYNYFPIKEIKRDEDSVLNISDELEYSYILRQLGEGKLMANNNDEIRLTYPCDDINLCNEYHMIKIKFNNKFAIMYHVIGYSNDNSGIKLVNKDSSMLKPKDIKILMKQSAKVNANAFCECRRPGNPWILEFNIHGKYSHHIISYHCQRGDGELKATTNFYFLLRGLSKKYFKKNCEN